MDVGRQHILAEIRRTAAANGGKPLGRQRFARETGIRDSDWEGRYWARWGDAVREAGFQPNKLQGRYDDDEVLAKLIPEIQRLGRLPTYRELRLLRRQDAAFPSGGVFEKFGTKRDLAAKLAVYCRRRGDLSDVLGVLAPLLREDAPPDGHAEPAGDPDFGFVYLLQSGRYYKLGRTNSVGRREYELAMQLPERATLVHQIRTDDPSGIERYWHRRFSERRKNGEWFKLTRDDVRAFKRRKFM